MHLTTLPRHTADERREEILRAALIAFADAGLDGTSTETIARSVGISQPYLFRLFGTKKELFIAAVERCFANTLETFRHAVEDGDPAQAVAARIGQAYVSMIRDRYRLQMQMQAYSACGDPDVRRAVKEGFEALTGYVREQTGFDEPTLARFMAKGMLLNVMASMDVLDATSGWAAALQRGCLGGDD